MKTIKNQKHLLSMGHLYKTNTIDAINKRQILDDDDRSELISVISSGSFEEYTQLDTFLREELMDILAKEFFFIDSEQLVMISNIITSAIENNNKAAQLVSNISGAVAGIRTENEVLRKLNSMICDYSERIDKE